MSLDAKRLGRTQMDHYLYSDAILIRQSQVLTGFCFSIMPHEKGTPK